MRFQLSLPQMCIGHDPTGQGWTAMRTFDHDRWMFALLAVLGALFFLLVIGIWMHLMPGAWRGDFAEANPLSVFAGNVLIVLVLHELVHLTAHPSCGLSSRSVVGFFPKLVAVGIVYDGELGRNRYIGVLLAPFVILTAIPLAIGALGDVAIPEPVMSVSVINAAGCVGDIVGAMVVFRRIPPSVLVRSTGARLWWRPAS